MHPHPHATGLPDQTAVVTARTAGPAAGRAYDEIDLSTLAFWAKPAAAREADFAELRAKRPVSWHRPAESTLPQPPDAPGFWAVVRHADIVEVSRRNDVFVSGNGVLFEIFPQDVMERALSFLVMDAPRHTGLRRLVSAAFTPKEVNRLQDQITANAKRIVEQLTEAGSGADFVHACAAKLPVLTLGDMLGIADEEREHVANAAESLLSAADPVFLAGRPRREVTDAAHQYLHTIAVQMAEERRSSPRDDLMTNLVQAEIDGEKLSNADIGSFFVLLSVAGTDTTRQTTTHALKALTDHPEQRAWLRADFDGRINSAVEEFVRWGTVIKTFARTAVTDYELGGRHIAAGDKVVMFYTSGNRDSEVFTDPTAFDLGRDPNPHLGFGGGGAHYCLGNQVAKAQLRALFRELLTQVPDIQAGEPEFLTSNFVHAVRAMPCSF
ncbi:cytochrome P450 [Streptomyces sp. NPDC096132]|uniref:cytochrome P450 n=1 Tax=Streptomyces sp. NPDC096132 TaxID=3366075 RepID=UPI00381C459D